MTEQISGVEHMDPIDLDGIERSMEGDYSLHTARLQIRGLINDVRERDAEIARLREAIAFALEWEKGLPHHGAVDLGDRAAFGTALSGVLAGKNADRADIAHEMKQYGDERAAAAREAAIEEAKQAAKGHDADRAPHDMTAAAYLAGRLDAAVDVAALAAKPGSEP